MRKSTTDGIDGARVKEGARAREKEHGYAGARTRVWSPFIWGSSAQTTIASLDVFYCSSSLSVVSSIYIYVYIYIYIHTSIYIYTYLDVELPVLVEFGHVARGPAVYICKYK